MNQIKSIIGCTLLMTVIGGTMAQSDVQGITSTTSGCREQVFQITAYYSPVPGQQFYLRHNYNAEVDLNGRGVKGSSGKTVFDGMLAAPRGYEYGSQIILPGLGLGEVADRGGAIVQGSGADRIDIWAGKGDLGLRHAKSIGHITMTGFVCSGGTINNNPGINWNVVPDYENFFDVAMRSVDQSTGRSDVLVKKLQEHLFKLGYAEDFTDGIYDDKMTAIVCRFQQDHMGMSVSDSSCGYFGSQTRATLMQQLIGAGLLDPKRLYQTTNFNQIHPVFLTNRRLTAGKSSELNSDTKQPMAKFEPLDVEPIIGQKHVIKNNLGLTGKKKLTLDTAIAMTVGTKKPTTKKPTIKEPLVPLFLKPRYPGETRNDVRDLKMILKREKLYNGKVDKIYDPQTHLALIAFQKKYKLINDTSDKRVVGVAGPATRALLEKMR